MFRPRKIHSGKVRDTYKLEDPELLLMVASDRISTHNVVHESEIPHKGYVLTALTVYWLTEIFPEIDLGGKHHLVAHGADIFDHFEEKAFDDPQDLMRRAIVVKNLGMLPVEFIFRSYLTGSLYSKYYSKGLGNPYGIRLPESLPKMAKFLPPIFTPTDKSETDDPMETSLANQVYKEEADLALKAYLGIQKHLNLAGIELIDSKIEVGVANATEVVIGDEAFTPDSSRFCRIEDIQEGQDPPWLDKQIARDAVTKACGSGKVVPITFSEKVIENLTQTYLGIFLRITGQSLDQFQDS